MPQLDGVAMKSVTHSSSTEMTPSQWSGNAVAWAASVLRRNSSHAYDSAPGTLLPRSASAHVIQPFTAYQDPPGHSVLLLTGGSDCSLVSGSFEAAAMAAP